MADRWEEGKCGSRQAPNFIGGCKAQAEEELGREEDNSSHLWSLQDIQGGCQVGSWKDRPRDEGKGELGGPRPKSSQATEHAFLGCSRIVQGIPKLRLTLKPYLDVLTSSFMSCVLRLWHPGPCCPWRVCPPSVGRFLETVQREHASQILYKPLVQSSRPSHPLYQPSHTCPNHPKRLVPATRDSPYAPEPAKTIQTGWS